MSVVSKVKIGKCYSKKNEVSSLTADPRGILEVLLK